jgi:hypothetical protein
LWDAWQQLLLTQLLDQVRAPLGKLGATFTRIAVKVRIFANRNWKMQQEKLDHRRWSSSRIGNTV